MLLHDSHLSHACFKGKGAEGKAGPERPRGVARSQPELRGGVDSQRGHRAVGEAVVTRPRPQVSNQFADVRGARVGPVADQPRVYERLKLDLEAGMRCASGDGMASAGSSGQGIEADGGHPGSPSTDSSYRRKPRVSRSRAASVYSPVR